MGSLFQAEIVAKQKLWIDVRFFEILGELCFNFIAFLKTWNILVGGFNPFEKICSSSWIISPNKRENEKIFETMQPSHKIRTWCFRNPTIHSHLHGMVPFTKKTDRKIHLRGGIFFGSMEPSHFHIQMQPQVEWLRPSWSWRFGIKMGEWLKVSKSQRDWRCNFGVQDTKSWWH